MPKSSDLEALRRALCRSVKNFLDKAGITSTICSGWTTMLIFGQWSKKAKMGWSGTGAKVLRSSIHNHRCTIHNPQSLMLPRTVDPAKMQTVEAMIKAPDHREKMPHIIKTILEFAFLTYSGRSDQWLTSFYRMISLIADLPKGPIKGNSMRKLAAKVTSLKYSL